MKFLKYFEIFEKFPNNRKYFGIVGVFVKEIIILNIGFGFCVFNSIWEHRLKIFFDPQKSNRFDPSKIENVPRSANIFV